MAATRRPEDETLEGLIGFGRELRRRGLPVGTGRIVTFCRAAAVLEPHDRDALYWAGRACLVSRPEDVDAFDATFDDWFRRAVRIELTSPDAGPWDSRGAGGSGFEERLVARTRGALADDEGPADGPDVAGDEGPEGDAAIRVVASAVELLRAKSFADLTGDERARVSHLIRELSVQVPLRSSRRYRAAPSGARFDVRRTLRRSLRTQGEPFDRAWRDRGTRARPLVLVLDVSGSMAPYSRALVQFAYAARAAGREVEVFVFSTRLTRVTRTLRTKDPDRAIREIGRQVADWEGGTRIGRSLKELVDGWGGRAVIRGAVVVICSDGLERGEPQLLRVQMAKLRRLVHRVVWVNPLKGSPRYEPLARGMAAALPSIDVFLPGHNLESLEELGRVLAG